MNLRKISWQTVNLQSIGPQTVNLRNNDPHTVKIQSIDPQTVNHPKINDQFKKLNFPCLTFHSLDRTGSVEVARNVSSSSPGKYKDDSTKKKYLKKINKGNIWEILTTKISYKILIFRISHTVCQAQSTMKSSNPMQGVQVRNSRRRLFHVNLTKPY